MKEDICGHFTDGDLIYGPKQARIPYIKLVKQRINPKQAITIEQLNFFNNTLILNKEFTKSESVSRSQREDKQQIKLIHRY